VADAFADLADELLDVAVTAATAAGGLLAGGLRRSFGEVTSKSSATDMVSEMDRAAEALVVDVLRRRRPDDALLAEEGSQWDGTSGVRWVVDPLDGTTNYLYGIPAFAVSVAAELEGQVVAGAVHHPLPGQTFTAVRGRGAFLDGSQLQVAGRATLETALVGTGFAYSAERRRRQAQDLVGVLPEVRDIRRSGSAALDLCWVACGRLDAYFEFGLAPWDMAAGALVAAEAGAEVGTLGGGPCTDDVVYAAPPQLAGPLRALLAAGGGVGAVKERKGSRPSAFVDGGQ